MGGSGCGIFPLFAGQQRPPFIWRAQYHYRLFIMALYPDDRLYRWGDIEQREDFEEE